MGVVHIVFITFFIAHLLYSSHITNVSKLVLNVSLCQISFLNHPIITVVCMISTIIAGNTWDKSARLNPIFLVTFKIIRFTQRVMKRKEPYVSKRFKSNTDVCLGELLRLLTLLKCKNPLDDLYTKADAVG